MTQGKTGDADSSAERRIFSKKCKLASLSLLAIFSIAMFVVFWCTNVFRNAILSGLEIRNGSMMFERWQRPSVRPAFRVRIFNYTNVEEFQSGRAKKLRIEEVGPYLYRETMTRVNPTLNSDGSLTYQEKRSFQWEGGSPDDEIVTVPNVPLLSAMAFTRDMNFVAQVGLTALLTGIGAKTFIDVSAGGYLWGYDDRIFEMAKPLVSLQENIPFDKFGILAIKNGVSPDRITIKTGVDNIDEIGMIKEINGQKSKQIWGDEECDKIEGTDGTIFPPNLFENRNTKLKIYTREMCRSMILAYHGRGNVRGIPTLTYKPSADSLTLTATKNNCYCSPNPNASINSPRVCPPMGFFNNSLCSYNLPFLTSLPHFYAAEQRIIDSYEGLHPRAEDHESLIEIHPRLGVPIGGYSRVQMNLEVRKATGVPFLGRVKDGAILPLVWVEVAIDKIPESLENLLYHAYYTAGTIETGMQAISLVGIIFSICSLMSIWRRTQKEKHGALKRNVSGQDPLIE